MQAMLTYSPDYAALGAWAGQFRKLLVVCGRSAARLPVGQFAERLPVPKVYFRDFTPNPRVEEAQTGADLLNREGCDAILVIGGGSAMDTAKAIGLLAVQPWAAAPLLPCRVPICAVPTTAGTGSESTPFAVVYLNGEKQSLAHGSILPQAVLLDPTALLTLPEYHRKASMLDALCHAVESAWCVHATPESRALALDAIGQVLTHWDAYLGNTPEGNAGMLHAANLAGRAIALTKTTAGHALCYKLTTLYGLPHGHSAALCVAALWPHMARTADAKVQGVFLQIAQALGSPTVETGIAKFKALVDSLGLCCPYLLDDLEVLCASVNPERLQNNPLPLKKADFEAIYRAISAPEE